MKIRFVYGILAFCVSSMYMSCSKVPTLSLSDETKTKMETLASSGELSTVEYTVEKIIKANDCAWWKMGDRKILFSCKAYLEGGINMSEYDASKTKINEQDKSIEITLPKVKLLSMSIPADEITLKYEKVSATRFNFSAFDRENILKQGEANIKNNVESIGILKDAETNANIFFTSMLKQMGYKSVNIKFE